MIAPWQAEGFIGALDGKRIAENTLKNIDYTMTYDRALIGVPRDPTDNIVSTSPVTTDIREAKVSVPMQRINFSLAMCLQDDQPRPDRDFLASFEASTTVRP